MQGSGPCSPLRLRPWALASATWCIVEIRKQRADDLRRIFDRYDADGSGTIELDECYEVVRELINEVVMPTADQRAAADDMARVVADEIFTEADEDGSGEIDFDEFWNCVRTILEKQRELAEALKTSTTLGQAASRVTKGRKSMNDGNKSRTAGDIMAAIRDNERQAKRNSVLSVSPERKSVTNAEELQAAVQQAQVDRKTESKRNSGSQRGSTMSSLVERQKSGSFSDHLWPKQQKKSWEASSSVTFGETMYSDGGDSRKSGMSSGGSSDGGPDYEKTPMSPEGKRGSILGGAGPKKG